MLADVIYVRFPTEAGDIPHYCLVVGVKEGIGGRSLLVAYGSSKKVSRDGHLATEIVVWDPRDLKSCGLRAPTRFDLRRLAWVDEAKVLRCGKLPRRLYPALKRAAIHTGMV